MTRLSEGEQQEIARLRRRLRVEEASVTLWRTRALEAEAKVEQYRRTAR